MNETTSQPAQDVQVTDVHTEHCCAQHGCKYSSTDSDQNCTVVSGRAPQSYACEFCPSLRQVEQRIADALRDKEFLESLAARGVNVSWDTQYYD